MIPRSLVLSAALLLSPAAVVRADTSVIYQSEGWSVFSGTANDGTEVCGLSATGHHGKYFGLKRYGNDDYLTIQAGQDGWSFDGGSVPVTITMDQNTPWQAEGITENDDDMVQVKVPLDNVREFMDEFGSSQTLDLQMGAGNVVDWSVDLTGSQDASYAFVNCIGHM